MSPDMNSAVLGFIRQQRCQATEFDGRYRYSAACRQATLYSSCAAAMTRHLLGEANRGAMFPTWFRLLALALIGKALPEQPLGRAPWQFVRCPGMQFWGPGGRIRQAEVPRRCAV